MGRRALTRIINLHTTNLNDRMGQHQLHTHAAQEHAHAPVVTRSQQCSKLLHPDPFSHPSVLSLPQVPVGAATRVFFECGLGLQAGRRKAPAHPQSERACSARGLTGRHQRHWGSLNNTHTWDVGRMLGCVRVSVHGGCIRGERFVRSTSKLGLPSRDILLFDTVRSSLELLLTCMLFFCGGDRASWRLLIRAASTAPEDQHEKRLHYTRPHRTMPHKAAQVVDSLFYVLATTSSICTQSKVCSAMRGKDLPLATPPNIRSYQSMPQHRA